MLREEIKQYLKNLYKAHDIIIEKMSTEQGTGAIVKYTVIKNEDDMFNESGNIRVIKKTENGFKISLPNLTIRQNF